MLKEPRLLLDVGRNINEVALVGHAKHAQGHRNFNAIGGAQSIKRDALGGRCVGFGDSGNIMVRMERAGKVRGSKEDEKTGVDKARRGNCRCRNKETAMVFI